MSFHDTLNPSGGVPMERVVDQPTPEQHLLERILSRENMERSWKQVKANHDAPGIDGIPDYAIRNSIRISITLSFSSLGTRRRAGEIRIADIRKKSPEK